MPYYTNIKEKLIKLRTSTDIASKYKYKIEHRANSINKSNLADIYKAHISPCNIFHPQLDDMF